MWYDDVDDDDDDEDDDDDDHDDDIDDDHDYEDGDIEEGNVLSWHKLSKWVSPRPRLTLGGHNVAPVAHPELAPRHGELGEVIEQLIVHRVAARLEAWPIR